MAQRSLLPTSRRSTHVRDLASVDVIPDPVVDDGDVVGQVQRGGGDEERYQYKEDQICGCIVLERIAGNVCVCVCYINNR